jgi:hypothetical protein
MGCVLLAKLADREGIVHVGDPCKCGWPLFTAGVGYEVFVPLSTHGCLGFLCWKFSPLVHVVCRRTTLRFASFGMTVALAERSAQRPLENTSCLILPRIGEGKQDDFETRCAGKRIDQFD